VLSDGWQALPPAPSPRACFAWAVSNPASAGAGVADDDVARAGFTCGLFPEAVLKIRIPVLRPMPPPCAAPRRARRAAAQRHHHRARSSGARRSGGSAA
jgi:hypothetical protein